MSLQAILGSALLSGIMCVGLQAAPLLGTFDIGGSITATATQIRWTSFAPVVPDQADIGSTNLSGSFGALGGTRVSISDLNTATEPAGTLFPAQPFISFLSPLATGFPTLNINFVYPGIYSPAGCAAPAQAVGQTCTPSTATVASPFSFVNTFPGGLNSTASFVFSGVTSDGQSNWSGIFTSQFGVPFQTVLNQLSRQGEVTNSYSATFVFTSAVPEPGTMSLLGLGLLVAGMKLRRRKV